MSKYICLCIRYRIYCYFDTVSLTFWPTRYNTDFGSVMLTTCVYLGQYSFILCTSVKWWFYCLLREVVENARYFEWLQTSISL